MTFLSQATGFLSHFMNEVNEHSLHTPFLYDLYTKAIKSDKLNGDFSEIELIRSKMLLDNTVIKISELGAGSKKNPHTERAIADIAKNSLTLPKYSQLFYRLVKYFNVRNIVELGTSFGINTLYLAKFEATKVYTFEGCENTAEIAKTNFEKYGSKNIEIIVGNLDHTLSSFLNGSIKPDMIYIDANHQFDATMRYFELILKNKHDQTFVIIDDINWSSGMQKAWNAIKRHPEVMLSLDLFRCGIVFFKHDLTKQHFFLKF